MNVLLQLTGEVVWWGTQKVNSKIHLVFNNIGNVIYKHCLYISYCLYIYMLYIIGKYHIKYSKTKLMAFYGKYPV